MPQLLPQMVAGTRYRNEVAVATYFLIEVAAATSHNHAYRAVVVAGNQVEDDAFWRSLKLYSIPVVILILI